MLDTGSTVRMVEIVSDTGISAVLASTTRVWVLVEPGIVMVETAGNIVPRSDSGSCVATWAGHNACTTEVDGVEGLTQVSFQVVHVRYGAPA